MLQTNERGQVSLPPDCVIVPGEARYAYSLPLCALVIWPETNVKVFDSELPSDPIAVMAATLIKAAIRPYSIAVAPASSFKMRLNNVMSCPLV